MNNRMLFFAIFWILGLFPGIGRSEECIASGAIGSLGSEPLYSTADTVSGREVGFDFSQLDWVTCFDSLHEVLKKRYAFTEWRGVDWDFKKTGTRPLIEAAMLDADTVAFTAAMYAYLYSIPDGHLMYRGDVSAFRQARQAGSYGMNMIPLTDGTVVANIVVEDGPAHLAGIRIGDQIISWNGIPVEDVPQLEVYNNYGGFATNYGTLEGRMLGRYEVLSRDSIGAVTEVVFQPYGTTTTQTVELTSVEDGYSTLLQAFFLTIPLPNFDSIVTWKVLDGEIGYLRILHEGVEGSTIEEIQQTKTYQDIKVALTYFEAQGINKLVMDLRFNLGGNDLLGAIIAGFFYNEQAFYEYATGNYDQGFAIQDTVPTIPQEPLFSGEVVVMVGPNCISTGEGIPMMIQRLPNGRVVSFWGTNGSFGMVGETIILSDSLQTITYPFGRSLNIDQVIQLDSDAEMVGGVQPDIRIPLTAERVIEQWLDGKDVELEFARGVLLDVPDLEKEDASLVYPNPTSGKCFFKHGSPDPMTLMITDLKGQQVMTIGNVVDGVVIDLSGLVPGIYFIHAIEMPHMKPEKLLVY